MEVLDELTKKLEVFTFNSTQGIIRKRVLNRLYGVKMRAVNKLVGAGRYSSEHSITTVNTAGEFTYQTSTMKYKS